MHPDYIFKQIIRHLENIQCSVLYLTPPFLRLDHMKVNPDMLFYLWITSIQCYNTEKLGSLHIIFILILKPF